MQGTDSESIWVANLLGTLPLDLQKFIAEQQQKIVMGMTMKNLEAGGPEALLGLMLGAAMFKDELGDKDE